MNLWTPPQGPPRGALAPRLWAGLALACTVGGGLGSAGFYAQRALSRPAAEDYENAAAWVRGHLRPGDGVIVRPFWAERMSEYLEEEHPVYIRHAADEDLDRYQRLLVVTVFDGHDTLESDLGASFAPPAETETFGPIRAAIRTALAPMPVVFDAREELAGAHVSMRAEGQTTPCPKRGDRHECGQEWNRVSPETLFIGGGHRPCIWAHPVSGKLLTIAFPAARIGEELVIRAGLTGEAVLMGGSPVTLLAYLGERELGALVVPNDFGWFGLRVKTGAAPGETGPLTFRITAPHDGMRHFCFRAETRAAAPRP